MKPSNVVTIHDAFSQGQRDCEQGWPADARRWGFVGAHAATYHAGYCQPREEIYSHDAHCECDGCQIEYREWIDETR